MSWVTLLSQVRRHTGSTQCVRACWSTTKHSARRINNAARGPCVSYVATLLYVLSYLSSTTTY